VVQGNAFGGGFESALSGNYLLAEESAKFSFPEVIFGTFPGMGAYNFLTNRVGYKKADEIIHSNKIYTAQEMNDLNIVDKVSEKGQGLVDMAELIKTGELERYSKDPFHSICNKVSRKQLLDVVDIWLDKAFKLSETNLQRMTKLARFQGLKIKRDLEKEPTLSQDMKMAQAEAILESALKR
jgi:DSF synthase